MNINLKGRVAVVGGSSKGLGRACAAELAAAGADVVICGRDQTSLDRAQTELQRLSAGRVISVQCDLSRLEDVNRLIETALNEFGRVDILVVNSGGPPAGSFFTLSQQDWDTAYRSILYYAIELYKVVIPQMKERRWGRIVNVASLTVKEPAESLLLSTVFRAGLASLAKTMSRELIPHGITINTVCPGAFRTDRAVQLMQGRASKTGETLEAIEQASTASLPLGRFQEPEELGQLVGFLASEAAAGITGTTIQVDAGAYRGLF